MPDYLVRLSLLMRRGVTAVVLLSALLSCSRDSNSNGFRTVPIRRGDLLVTISATGTVEPEEVIDVGAQVAGKINSFGIDKNNKTIDYGSPVDEGTILAQIDDSLYAADVAQRTAELELSRAQLLQAEAKLLSAEADWKRAQRVGPSPALSQSNYDTYRANFESAKAAVAAAQATIQQATAGLTRAQRNLEYCTIKSPVKGTIIDKRVNIGQTVVSSLNAPSLFLLAKDLTRLEVWVSVNEADIGSIHPGQNVRFGVDAFPNETFAGIVRKIRLNATMTQNVVTYIVEVETNNENGRLLPYLTASAQFEASNRKNVLLVPNAALRWSPDASLIDKKAQEQVKRSAEGGSSESPPLGREEGMIWMPAGDLVRPVKVTIGGSDGMNTEIQSGEIADGAEVVIGRVNGQEKAETENVNPFTPKIRAGRRG